MIIGITRSPIPVLLENHAVEGDNILKNGIKHHRTLKLMMIGIITLKPYWLSQS